MPKVNNVCIHLKACTRWNSAIDLEEKNLNRYKVYIRILEAYRLDERTIGLKERNPNRYIY